MNTLAASGQIWRAGSATSAGRRHVERGSPGQDAADAGAGPRPFALVCDGRGSSELSHHGSAAAKGAFARMLRCAEPLLRRLLDDLDPDDPLAHAGWRDVVTLFLGALGQAQESLALEHGVATSEFEFTISAAVVGRRGVGILQLGDSCLVVERQGQTSLAAPPQTGAFAGETNFVSDGADSLKHADTRILSGDQLTGILAFTDGVAARWLHHRTLEPAPGVGQILGRLTTGAWNGQRLQDYLNQPFWSVDGDDDRGVAFLVRVPEQTTSAESPESPDASGVTGGQVS